MWHYLRKRNTWLNNIIWVTCTYYTVCAAACKSGLVILRCLNLYLLLLLSWKTIFTGEWSLSKVLPLNMYRDGVYTTLHWVILFGGVIYFLKPLFKFEFAAYLFHHRQASLRWERTGVSYHTTLVIKWYNLTTSLSWWLSLPPLMLTLVKLCMFLWYCKTLNVSTQNFF